VQSYAQYGYLGVEFFFLISGFVICMSCWGKSPKDFFISRVIRLYPAFWAALLITVAVAVLVPYPGEGPSGITPSQVITNLTMFPGPLHTTLVQGVYWTLWVEARFYVMMGLLMLGIGLTYRRVVVFCGVWLFLGLVDMDTGRPPVLEDIATPLYSGLFVAGICIYLMRRYGQNIFLWGMLGFAWCLELTMLHYRMGEPEHSIGHKLSWTVSAGLLTLGLLALVAVALGPLGRIQWRWLTTAGALTYPLYLLHERVGNQLITLLNNDCPWMSRKLVVALVASSMLLLAWIVHRFIEKPVARQLKRALLRAMEQGWHPKPR
jgi:peptidoglycan/LPS O-acetylase OafA/YrhL